MDEQGDSPRVLAPEGAMPASRDIQIDLLRNSAVNDIKNEQIRDADLKFEASPHFIVLYRNPTIFTEAGSDPQSLTQSLERGLRISSDFGIELSEELHVVEMGKGVGIGFGGLLRDDMEPRTIKEGKRVFGIAAHPEIDFSRVLARKAPDLSGNPEFVGNAIRLLIGDHVVSQLMEEPGGFNEKNYEFNRLIFVRQGLSYYIQYLSQGIDPDDVMKLVMADYVNNTKRWLGHELEDFEDASKARKIAIRKDLPGQISMEELFQLKPRQHGTKATLMNAETANYRGASFVNFLIDKLGMDEFKRVVRKTYPKLFMDDLATTTGLTLEQIEAEWKDHILSTFESNSLLDGIEQKDLPQPEIQRDRVRDIYQQYS